MSKKILVTGANGQIGTVLTHALKERHGANNVIASDIIEPEDKKENFVFLDILNEERFREVISDHKITEIYHLAAILSANGEWNPLKTWNVNFNAFLNLLELSKESSVNKIFFPSTIAVFGKTTPPNQTPQDCPLLPETVYGISKVSGELWCNYYHKRYNLDVRSLRYPGIISHQSIPSGGTTDYAVEIFHKALQGEKYTCFLKEDTALPMMYIDDAIRATIELMEADRENLLIRYSYNLAAMSFTPEQLAVEIKKHIPNFEIDYIPDFRQEIAESWTKSIDDSHARKDWHWNHIYNLEKMVNTMIENLKPKYQK